MRRGEPERGRWVSRASRSPGAVMTTSEFLDYLARSELVSLEKLDEIRAEAVRLGWLDSEAQPFAEQLIKLRILTPFHVERLLRGKWRNFVINEKFRVLDRLDAGDLGIFFRCEHLTLRKIVTLRSHAAFATDDPEADQQGLLDRIRQIAPIHDPHLVRLIDIERVNQQPLLVMEDLTGPSVEELVRQQGPMGVDQAACYMVQAALGLQTLHEASWLHGDCRPARMIFDPQGNLKLIDAGICDWLGNPRQGSRSKSRTGERGFPSWDYAAPETHQRGHEPDGRADLYALGCSLYHLLAGQPPFAAFGSGDKLKAHQFAEPPSLAGKRKDVPAKVQNLVTRLLAKKPDDRPGTAIEVAQELLPWARDLLPPVSQAMLGIASFSSDMPPEVETRRRKTKGGPSSKTLRKKKAALAASRKSSSKKWLVSALAAGVALVAITIFLVVLFSGQEMKPQDRLAAIRKAVSENNNAEAVRLLVAGLEKAGNNEAERRPLVSLVSQLKRDELVRQLAAERPNDPEIAFLVGEMEYRARQWLSAMTQFTSVTSADPKKAEAWQKRAECNIFLGRWFPASQVYQELVKLRENDAAVWARHAVVLARAGNTPELETHLAAMWDKFKDSRNPADHAHVGLAFAVSRDAKIGNYPELLNKVEAAAERLATQGWPRFVHGALLFRLGRHAEAKAALQAAVEDLPNWTSRQMCVPILSMCILKEGNRAEASRMLAEVDSWARITRKQISEDPFVPITTAWWDWAIFDQTLAEAQLALNPGVGSPPG